ncbi:ribosome-associated protein [Chitinophaga skermanii]|uniref:Ribosome-associated protein n=1 Tax=Chitinophaga skermanii TaxID=331697 RepID=A0A327QQB1_9BACT|nr:ribosome-associated protein [Chitinophaga skermanii]
MTAIDLSSEIKLQTARSGGSGGQNVNKVETMVIGHWHVQDSALLTPEQKAIVLEKLANRINAEGFLVVKSQQERSQLGNKHLVIKKINELVKLSLKPKKRRVATKVPKGAIEKRKDNKKRLSEKKQNRRNNWE